MDRVAVRAALAVVLGAVVGAPGAAAAPPPPPGERAVPEVSVAWIGPDGALLAADAFLALATTPPPERGADPESYAVLVSVKAGTALPKSVTISSTRAPETSKSRLALEVVERALTEVPCPAAIEPGHTCAKAAPVRLVVDEIDRRHPLLEGRALLAEIGGVIEITGERVRGDRRRVAGQRPRSRGRLRVHLVRLEPKGPPPIGLDAEDAVRLAREEIDRASSVWSACGITFGPSSEAEVTVVDPPPPFLISLGCEAPTPAAGGSITFVVDGKEATVAVAPGTTPRGAARLVAAKIEALGFSATLSDNPVPHAAPLGSSDVLVRRKNGKAVAVQAPKKGLLSSDDALEVCIGRVDMSDGVQHFTDADAASGTLEERTLVKAFDDNDPSTLEVFVVPSFGGDTRIGESFIFLEHGAIRNVVLEDRAGFRAQRASFTLAHEIGHVLLDQPGHPDDFGADTPTSLMDSDAVAATAFGPRRLSPAECARAFAQSGPETPSRVLAPWPLAPVEGVRKKAKSR